MDKRWKDQPVPVRQGEELPLTTLEPYLKAQLNLEDGQLEVQQFPSGYSNLTYFLRIGEREMVLRRPPFGANIKSAHDMSREYRILSHLTQVFPKVPRPLLYCEDGQIMDAPFYVMERVEGVILRANMPEAMVPPPETMAGIARAFVGTLVDLHRVDVMAAGLDGLGKPEGYIQRQVEGWTRRYLKAKTDEIEAMEAAAKWLADHQPQESGVALVHNDFKYDNLVLSPADWTEVRAVLDWEMATVADPLMDLGTSLGYWVNADDPPFLQALKFSPTTSPGNPTREALVHQYSLQSGREVAHPVFYYVYGLFKLGVIIQQIYARYKKGYTQDPRFARLIDGVKACGAVAMQAIQKNQLDQLF